MQNRHALRGRCAWRQMRYVSSPTALTPSIHDNFKRKRVNFKSLTATQQNHVIVILSISTVSCDVNVIYQDSYFKRDDFKMSTHTLQKGGVCARLKVVPFYFTR